MSENHSKTSDRSTENRATPTATVFIKTEIDEEITLELDETPRNEDETEKFSLSNSGVQPVNCQMCNCSFTNIADLQTHTIEAHVPRTSGSTVDSPSLVCPHCELGFSSLLQFASHMKQHISTSPSPQATPVFLCQICGLSFGNEQTRFTHLMIHFSDHATTTFCETCQIALPNAGHAHHYLQRHLQLQYFCTICAQVFESELDFKHHSSKHSNEVSLLQCRLCKIVFENKDLLITHVKFVHDKDIKSLLLNHRSPVPQNSMSMKIREPCSQKKVKLHCSVCDAEFSTDVDLEKHRLEAHCKIPHSEKCSRCEKPIPGKSEFLEHALNCPASNLNSDPSSMYCPVCRQSLRTQIQLKLHAHFHYPNSSEVKEEEKSVITEKEAESTSHEKIDDTDQNLLKSPENFVTNPEFQTIFDQIMEEPANSLKSKIPTISKYVKKSEKRKLCCGLAFKTKHRYERHLRKHDHIKHKVCQICGEKATNQEEHMKMHRLNIQSTVI